MVDKAVKQMAVDKMVFIFLSFGPNARMCCARFGKCREVGGRAGRVHIMPVFHTRHSLSRNRLRQGTVETFRFYLRILLAVKGFLAELEDFSKRCLNVTVFATR